jgi:hypothetical protein
MRSMAHWSASFEANKLTQKLSPCLREFAEFGALSRIYTEEPRAAREEEKSCVCANYFAFKTNMHCDFYFIIPGRTRAITRS